MLQLHITPMAADLLEYVNEIDAVIRQSAPIAHGLDQVDMWLADAVEAAMTLTYRPPQATSNHKHTTWAYVPIADDAPIQITRDHITMLRMVQPPRGQCCTYVSWLVPGQWVLLRNGAYALDIKRERITGRILNHAI